MKKENFQVDVAPEMALYRILQRQAYGIETALAEFVDNSIQSFLENEDMIKKIEPSATNLKIRIAISSSEKEITIEDNAGGIDRANFQRAIRMGNHGGKAPERNSLSVYGIGMKSAAIWFSNRWTIETSALGSEEKLTTTFNLDQLLATGDNEIEVESSPEATDEHYTRITINECLRDLGDNDNKFSDVVLSFLRESFYKFENVFIEMEHDHLALKPTNADVTEPSPLIYPRVDKNGEKVSDTPVEWRKKLNFNHQGKLVTGFVMIRETGSYHGPGIRLLRNNRVISGTRGGGKQNKPEVLLGTSNKYAAQRIYGEIHLNDFAVNFMKTGFDINIDSLYRAIATEISSRPPEVLEDYLLQATSFRKKKISNGSKRKKKTRKPLPTVPKEIPFSPELNDALEKLSNKKLYRLYGSLCRVSLIVDPVLAYVGAWTLLESLSTSMNKTSKIAFSNFLSGQVDSFSEDRERKKDLKSVINDIHQKGNLNKHSADYESINAEQLANDFPLMEKFLIYCSEKISGAEHGS